MIYKIRKAYVRTYSDSGQSTAYIEWVDAKGRSGRTEGTAEDRDFRRQPFQLGRKTFHLGQHIACLFARAAREGVTIQRERW